MIDCGKFEILLADSLDGLLSQPGREQDRAAFHEHFQSCAACATLAGEAASAVAFMDMAAAVEPPTELVGKILFATNSGWELKLRDRGIRGWINRVFAPVLQPRLAMGAMVTLMSLTMLSRWAGGDFDNEKQGAPTAGVQAGMTIADLNPVHVWAAFDSRSHRIWDRAVKGYESMRLVYEIRSQVEDWNEKSVAANNAADDEKARSREVKPAPATSDTK